MSASAAHIPDTHTNRLGSLAALLAALALMLLAVTARADDVRESGAIPRLRGREIEVNRGVVDVSGGDLATDRPELSRFGDELVFTVEEGAPDPVYILSIYHARQAGFRAWESPWLLREGRAGYDDGTLVSWFFPAFTPWDDTLVSGKGTMHRGPDGAVDFLTLDTRFVSLSEGSDAEDTLATTGGLGFPFGEIPQGGRVSPDGRWLAFFAQSTPEVRGIYLLSLETGALHHLSTGADHDPVWSATGRTLFFHEQGAGASTIGRLDLRFSRGTPTPTRTLLPSGMSEEHPAPVFGTDVLFTHVQTDHGTELAARRSCSGFTPFPVRLAAQGVAVSDARRPATALFAPRVTFMGKLPGDAHFRVFTLDALTTARIALLVARVPCPSPERR